MRTDEKTGGTGRTGRDRIRITPLFRSRLPCAKRDHRDRRASVVPSVPPAELMAGPDKSLTLNDGPGGPVGPDQKRINQKEVARTSAGDLDAVEERAVIMEFDGHLIGRPWRTLKPAPA